MEDGRYPRAPPRRHSFATAPPHFATLHIPPFNLLSHLSSKTRNLKSKPSKIPNCSNSAPKPAVSISPFGSSRRSCPSYTFICSKSVIANFCSSKNTRLLIFHRSEISSPRNSDFPKFEPIPKIHLSEISKILPPKISKIHLSEIPKIDKFKNCPSTAAKILKPVGISTLSKVSKIPKENFQKNSK